MRWMIVRMIATGSLSAFSAGLQGPAALGGGAVPVRTIKLPSATPTPAPALSAPAPGSAQPGRALPRGSLLDLSV